MRDIVKDYIENCIEMAKTSIKIHKKFSRYDNGFWLSDADKYIEDASLAIEYDMLPSELKHERLEWLGQSDQPL